MPPVTLVPLSAETAFLRQAARGSSLFTVKQEPSPDAVIAMDAASDTDVGGTLRRTMSERPQVVAALAGGAALLLDCCTEGPAFHEPTWAKVHAHLDAVGLAGARVVYITNNHAFRRPYQRWAEARPGGAMAVLPYNYFFRSVVNGIRPRLLRAQERRALIGGLFPFSTPRPARFLCLNHRLRSHRLVVLGRLVRLGVLDRGYVSVLGGDPDRPQLAPEAALKAAHDLFPRFATDVEAFRTLINRMPITITADTSANSISSISLPMYSQAWFSLVNESEMTLGGISRFTEKSVKPLVAAHPALIAGNPGVLALLRSYGFETFASRIDEAYDKISDRQDRLDALLTEFERLMRLTEGDMSRLAADLWPVHDANLRHIESGLLARLSAEDRAVAEALAEALAPIHRT